MPWSSLSARSLAQWAGTGVGGNLHPTINLDHRQVSLSPTHRAGRVESVWTQGLRAPVDRRKEVEPGPPVGAQGTGSEPGLRDEVVRRINSPLCSLCRKRWTLQG